MKDLIPDFRRFTLFLLFFLLRFFDCIGKEDSSRIWQEMAGRAVLNNPQKAFLLGGKSLKSALSSKEKNPKFLLRNHEILAEASIRLFQPDVAFRHLFEAMEIASLYKLQTERIRCLLLMGQLNWILEDPSKSLYYFSEAARLSTSAGDFRLQLLAEGFMAYQKIRMNPPGERADFEKVRELLDFVSVSPLDTLVFAQATNLMGNAVAIHKADADLASRYYQQAVSLSEQAGDDFMALSYGQNLAESLMNQGNYPAAEARLGKILNSARKINSDMLVYSSLKLLSSCAAQRMDFRRAYEWQKAYEELKSRHLNVSQQRRTNEILQSYIQNKKEIKLREQENARLAGMVESEKKLRKYQFYFLGFLFVLFVLTVFFISNRIRLRKIRKQRVLTEQQNAALEILNEKLRQQSAEAQKAKEEAEFALNAKADFISVITHEIKTPIHAVIAASHLLEDAGNSIQTRTNLEILRISAENLYGLINNVLDFNKIESGKIELEPKPFSLQDLLTGIQLSFNPQAQEKGIDLQFRVDKNLPPAFLGDRLRIGQIFSNLISNAIKFTHKGFVKTEIQYRRGANGKSWIEVCIKDSGIGISLKEKDRIFDFFSQANPHIPARYGGSGLGLTIVSRLLGLMGSRLLLKSELGQGSEFSFSLDLPETDVIFLRSDRNAGGKADLSQFRLLFVDDVEYNRILAQRFFEKWHISYDFARNGREALDLAAKHMFDIILMDIRLPDGEGYDFSVKIREIKGNEHVPILAMTAADRNEIENKLHESGMQDFIGKPFSPEDLRQVLEKWLIKLV